MSFTKEVNYEELDKILGPVEVALGSDLEGLRRKDERERAELWNRIKTSQTTFENEFLSRLAPDLKRELGSRFCMAKLLLAAAADANCEESPVVGNFNRKELDLVQDFERFNVFDVLSTEEIVQRIARREDIYDLIIDFYQKQYSNLDELLDAPDVQKDLKLAFKNQYKKRLNKIVEGVKAYVGQYGPVIVVTQVEKKIWDMIKESEAGRKSVAAELERQITELTSGLEPLGKVDEESELFKRKLSELEVGLATGSQPKELGSLTLQKDDILKRYINLEKGLSTQAQTISQRRRELESREAELEKARQEYQEQMQEEKRRLVESELSEIEALKGKLLSQGESFESERAELERKREELDSRLQDINDVLEGKPIRIIAKEDAKLCELNFIARFETKMEALPLKLYSPIENRNYEIKSWKEGTHLKFAEGGTPEMPTNTRSRYAVFEKKYGFFGEKKDKVVVEAISLNHLEEFGKYGFDARRANMADFLGVITRFINAAEMGKYLHVLGVASPTGWDNRVKKEIESSDFAHNYVSRHVSICLVDSVTGDVFYNPSDDRISKFVEFFQPQFDKERVAKVRNLIRDKLSFKGYGVFNDILEEANEKREIVNKAFHDLEAEGKCRMRIIKDVGVVLETIT